MADWRVYTENNDLIYSPSASHRWDSGPVAHGNYTTAKLSKIKKGKAALLHLCRA